MFVCLKLHFENSWTNIKYCILSIMGRMCSENVLTLWNSIAQTQFFNSFLQVSMYSNRNFSVYMCNKTDFLYLSEITVCTKNKFKNSPESRKSKALHNQKLGRNSNHAGGHPHDTTTCAYVILISLQINHFFKKNNFCWI
jgi:hypothetical protein